jgi:hypothetical protein
VHRQRQKIKTVIARLKTMYWWQQGLLSRGQAREEEEHARKNREEMGALVACF